MIKSAIFTVSHAIHNQYLRIVIIITLVIIIKILCPIGCNIGRIRHHPLPVSVNLIFHSTVQTTYALLWSLFRTLQFSLYNSKQYFHSNELSYTRLYFHNRYRYKWTSFIWLSINQISINQISINDDDDPFTIIRNNKYL